MEFRLNACPICLTCLDCENKYGQNCTCQARKITWKKKIIERDYAVNFRRKALTQKGATSQKVVLDSGFVDWFFNNISSSIELSLSSPPDDANVCQDCMNRYHSESMFYIIFIVFFTYRYIYVITLFYSKYTNIPIK